MQIIPVRNLFQILQGIQEQTIPQPSVDIYAAESHSNSPLHHPQATSSCSQSDFPSLSISLFAQSNKEQVCIQWMHWNQFLTC